jgi:hypothetical protein
MTACNDNEPQVINYYLDNPATVQGQLSGKFSVSPTKQVSFSQGNLQYNAAQNVWRFADNQYDYVGDASFGTVTIGNTKCSNQSISNTYNGWIDLFGWGTGSNPTKSVFGNAKYSTVVDWGQNKIYNGGDKVKLWRTLTRDEWVYLFHGRKDAEKKFALGHIYLDANKSDSVNGLFLLPDSWTKPADIEFNLSTNKGLEWNPKGYYYNANEDSFKHNAYTLDDWAKMETNGAVFLPCFGGYRSEKDVNDIINGAFYWSSTPISTVGAYCMRIYGSYFYLQSQCNRFYGCAVRLVR